MIRCSVLGPLQIAADDDDGIPAALLWRKHSALLIYLARAASRRHTRAHLVGVLWPDKAEAAARHSLNEALRVIRRALGDTSIAASGDDVQLADGVLDLDADRFEWLCAAGRWNAAAALVRGEFLEGFSIPDSWAFEEWLASERRAWRGRCADALTCAADVRLAAGGVDAAADLAGRALQLEPAAEPAWRIGMLARAIRGDRAGALALWDECVRTLDERYGIEPGAESTDLAGQIRRERHWRWLHGQGGRPPGGPSRRAPLVDREAALAAAVHEWRRCSTGEGAAIVLVSADPGAGRSRFMEEIAARARLSGADVAAVRAVEGDAAHHGATLNTLLGTLPRPLLDASPRARGPREDEPSVLIRTACQQRAVLLAVDDAHYADRTSLLELERCVRTLARERLLLLMTRAPFPPRDEIDALVSKIGRDVRGVVVTLQPLSPVALVELVRWALPAYDDDAARRLARRIAVETAGLPLLVVELLHAIALGLELSDDPAPWPSPYRTMDHTLPAAAPETITAAVRVGFRRLSSPAQRTLAALSLLGERASSTELAAAAALEAATLENALDELEWQRWIVAEPRGFGFTARLARSIVARDMVTGGERQRILARTGR